MGFINTAANVFSAGSNRRTAKNTKRLVKIERRRDKNAARAAGRYVGPYSALGNLILDASAKRSNTPKANSRYQQQSAVSAARYGLIAPTAARPGWYLPQGETQLRWWDGQQWTMHTSPVELYGR